MVLITESMPCTHFSLRAREALSLWSFIRIPEHRANQSPHSAQWLWKVKALAHWSTARSPTKPAMLWTSVLFGLESHSLYGDYTEEIHAL